MKDKTVYIGSHLFTPAGKDPAEIGNLVEKMYKTGMKMIRVYPYWSDVERFQEDYDFSAVDACYRAAEKYGLKILHTFKPNSPPQWMRLSGSFNLDDITDLDNPAIWNPLLKFVETTVRRYQDSPALYAWCVWNEPRIFLPQKFTPHLLKSFREFLRKAYRNDISLLNRNYFYQYKSFDELYPEDCAVHPANMKDYPEQMDFRRFNTDYLTRKIGEIRACIEKLDPVHFFHANSFMLMSNGIPVGESPWLENSRLDFPGASVYPAWQELAHIPVQHGFVCDFLRSLSRDRHFWITETQGGMAFYTSRNPCCPSPEILKLWLCDMVGSGAKGIIYWSLTQTIRGEWSLLNLENDFSERSSAIAAIAGIVESNRELFEAARPAEPEIWLLNSETANELDAVRGRTDIPALGGAAHKLALIGAWNLLTTAGYEAGFIDEKRLCSGELPADAVLIAPSCSALPENTLKTLEKWVSGGGTLIADGPFAMMNEHGLAKRENKQLADRIFGTVLLDYVQASPEETLEPGQFPFFLLKAVFAKESRSIIDRTHGNGRAIRIGTMFFCNFTSPGKNAEGQEILKENFDCRKFAELFLPPRKNGVVLDNASQTLRLRRLEGNTPVYTVLNFGNPVDAILNAEGTFTDLLDRTEYSARDGKLKLRMNRHTVKMLMQKEKQQ